MDVDDIVLNTRVMFKLHFCRIQDSSTLVDKLKGNDINDVKVVFMSSEPLSSNILVSILNINKIDVQCVTKGGIFNSG